MINPTVPFSFFSANTCSYESFNNKVVGPDEEEIDLLLYDDDDGVDTNDELTTTTMRRRPPAAAEAQRSAVEESIIMDVGARERARLFVDGRVGFGFFFGHDDEPEPDLWQWGLAFGNP